MKLIFKPTRAKKSESGKRERKMFVIYFEKYQIALGEWERDCVCERERERERERGRERERKRERERERESKGEREREGMGESLCVCVCLKENKKSWFIKKGKIAKAWKNCFGKGKKLS